MSPFGIDQAPRSFVAKNGPPGWARSTSTRPPLVRYINRPALILLTPHFSSLIQLVTGGDNTPDVAILNTRPTPVCGSWSNGGTASTRGQGGPSMRQMIRAWKPALVATGVLALLVAGGAGSTGTAQTPEWHQWRGANRDGRSAETGLLQQWPASGPRQIWRATGAGEGYSSFSTSGGRLFTMGARGGTEYVMAFDLETGRKVWETPNGRRFRNDRGDGPRGTPTVDGDRLYALGGSGTLACLDAQTGRPVWAVDVLDRFGGYNPNWGLSESPLVL